MNLIDKISKETLNLLEYSKDVVKSNLTNSNINGTIKPSLTESQLASLYKLVDMSISQSFQKGILSFQKTLKAIVDLSYSAIDNSEPDSLKKESKIKKKR